MKAEKFTEVKPPHMQTVTGIWENGDEVDVMPYTYNHVLHMGMVDGKETPPPTRWFMQNEFKEY